MASVLELWDSIADSGGRVIILEGGSGSGKSSVLRAVQDETDDDCEILVGAEWSRKVPYAMLGQLRTRDPIWQSVDGECSASDRVQIAESLLEELQSEDEEKRIVVLDDVHLADPESLQIFSQLGRRLRGTRVLLLIAIDPETSAEVDPDFLRMTTSPVSERVTIPDFGRADALELARAQGVYDIGEHGASVLVAQSSGRLRVAQEILSLLPESRWPAEPAELPMPDSMIREVLDPIEATGSTEVSDVASALAILGGPQDLARIASVATLHDPGPAVDLGVAHGVFRERNSAGRLTLALSRTTSARVIVAAMAPSTRRIFHERAADSAYREDERLVHLAAAALGADGELARRLRDSAAVAERFGRWADAAELHFGAARVLAPSADRDDELLAGIDALASAGRVVEVLPWIDIGKNIAPSTLRDTVLANVAIHRGHAAQADDLLSRAAAAPTDDDGLTAQIALRRTLDSLVRWDGPKVREWANRAMSLGGVDEPANVESHAMRALGFAAQGKIDEAMEDLEDLSDRHLTGAQNQRVRLCVGWVSMLAGDLREAVREFEAAVPTQYERGSLRISLWAHGWLARVQYLLGEWDEGLRTAEIGLRRADGANISLVAPLLNWTAAEIKLWRGQPVDEVMRRADSSAILSDYLAMQVPARLVRAVAANVRGDHDGRAAALRPLLDVDSWTQDRASFWPWSTEYVDALITLGHSDQAQQVAADFKKNTAEAREHIRAQSALASARIHQDRGDIPAAEAEFSRALELFTRSQQDTATAQVLLRRGQMLRRANRRREAVESLVRAREFYEGVGATVLIKRCDQELRATGMSWRGMSETDNGRSAVKTSVEAGGYVPLTPQEMSVADLVVQGMTNAEVSRKLFIAEKTVQYHLTHIYGKFGIRSRTELAAVHLSGDVPSV
ncbi:LuxR C-terminal-related transcriptional regulator [Brevibacterium aurantiacum]|uniref:LuxR C-terminal-related transcriptional regulator n=1 Tax=Brevibacterium aurantiacum TaxID=273384 RepID=UPI00240849E9|nr:LuxR C-terminal-related transcriptional regulator [Brevibacterium aurantiacum]